MKLSDRIHSKSDLLKENHRQEFCNLKHSATEQSERPIGKVQFFWDLIEKLWQRAIATLFPDLPEEADLKIENEKDRYGNTHWHARDPWTGKSVFFASESEVLRWIDSLYRQSH